jgi:hypothetical protein
MPPRARMFHWTPESCLQNPKNLARSPRRTVESDEPIDSRIVGPPTNPHQMTESASRPRRFFRFNLRCLFAVVTVCCIAALFVKARYLDPVFAADEVIDLGGGFSYESQTTRVNFVHLGQTDIQDLQLRALGRLTYLRELWLNDTQITDAGLKSLADIAPRLTMLDIRGTPVSRHAVDELQRRRSECKIIADWSPDEVKRRSPRGYNCPKCDTNFFGHGGEKPCPTCSQICTAPQ